MGAGSSTSLIATAVWWQTAKTSYTATGFAEASKQFRPKELDVDLTGKVMMVTGANSGLGKRLIFRRKNCFSVHWIDCTDALTNRVFRIRNRLQRFVCTTFIYIYIYIYLIIATAFFVRLLDRKIVCGTKRDCCSRVSQQGARRKSPRRPHDKPRKRSTRDRRHQQAARRVGVRQTIRRTEPATRRSRQQRWCDVSPTRRNSRRLRKYVRTSHTRRIPAHGIADAAAWAHTTSRSMFLFLFLFFVLCFCCTLTTFQL